MQEGDAIGPFIKSRERRKVQGPFMSKWHSKGQSAMHIESQIDKGEVPRTRRGKREGEESWDEVLRVVCLGGRSIHGLQRQPLAVAVSLEMFFCS